MVINVTNLNPDTEQETSGPWWWVCSECPGTWLWEQQAETMESAAIQAWNHHQWNHEGDTLLLTVTEQMRFIEQAFR